MMKRLNLKKGDLVLIAVLLLAGALLLLLRGGKAAVTANVTVNGELLYEIDLTAVKAPFEVPLENGVTLYVAPGAVRFLHSDCRGQDCVRCGALTRAGQAAACLPNKTLVSLSGKPPRGAPDAISS